MDLDIGPQSQPVYNYAQIAPAPTLLLFGTHQRELLNPNAAMARWAIEAVKELRLKVTKLSSKSVGNIDSHEIAQLK